MAFNAELSHAEFEISPGFVDAARKQLAKLKVKNTFIDMVDSDDEYERGPFVRPMHSCPAWSNDEAAPLEKQEDLATGAWRAEVASASRAMPQPSDPPCLLTSRPVLMEFDSKMSLKVKNTFIDGTASDDDDDDRPAMMKRMSMPCRPRVDLDLEGAEEVMSRSETTSSMEAVPSNADSSADPAMRNTCIEPLETRQPQPSRGGQLHASGNCKPCAWYWRPQGCNNGEECGHCHLCSAAELKSRKKAKKLTSQRMRAATAQEEAPEVPSPTVPVSMPAAPSGAILVPALLVQ
eukprot:TRINITY_DN3352_c0_g1_i1.p1 TRINITY_DN3352_c0_g1~~TRINITY_DN3352_c0_g1_i1.p1  ORF type:complete len:323 (+),score=74.29 TRINITY_DN3352_c0_g1_i1:96-971(+)